MMIQTKALVLSSLKYGDSGMIVRCFTRDSGLKSFFINGIFNTKKSKFKRSFFQPLNQLELVTDFQNKGQLHSLKEVNLVRHYQEIHTEIVKQSMTLFLSELLNQILKEESTDESLYDFLVQSINLLDETTHTSHFHLVFLAQLIKQLGFYPIMDHEDTYFDLVEGKFVSHPQNQLYLEGDALQLFVKVLQSDLTQLSELKLTYPQRTETLEWLFQYMNLHIASFKKPKSLVVLQELFH